MATKVEESGVEVNTWLTQLRPVLNGLRDLAILEVGAEPGQMSPQAHEQAVQSIARHEKRIKALRAHKETGDALMADGHPDMPPTAIDPAALESIKANAASVVLAASTFISNALPAEQAAGLNPTPGMVEPKPAKA